MCALVGQKKRLNTMNMHGETMKIMDITLNFYCFKNRRGVTSRRRQNSFTLFIFHFLVILSFLSICILLSLFPYLLIPFFLLAALSVTRYVRTVHSVRYQLPTCKLLPYQFHVSTRNTISNQRLTFMQPNVPCCLVVV